MPRLWWRRKKPKFRPQEGPNEYERFKTFPLWKKAYTVLKAIVESRGCAIGWHKFQMLRTTTQEFRGTGERFREMCMKRKLFSKAFCGKQRKIILV